MAEVAPIAVAVPIIGADGAVVVIVILLLAELAAPVPITLVAVTVNVYAIVGVSPYTIIVPDPA